MIDVLGDISMRMKLFFMPEMFLRPMGKSLRKSVDLIGVEVGVRYGFNAKAMLSCLDIKRLFLVDISDVSMKIAKSNLQGFKGSCVYIVKSSVSAISDIPDNVDFVYIDACHVHPSVDDDIRLYYSKVRTGGVLGGHDYHMDFPDVVEAVDTFVEKEDLMLYHSNSDWWVVKEGILGVKEKDE